MPSSTPDLGQCGGLLGGGLWVAGENDVAGEEDLLRVAPDFLAVLVQDVALVGELLGRASHEVPVLGEPGCSAKRPLLTAASDADRRVGALHRLGLVTGLGELVVLALECRRLLR